MQATHQHATHPMDVPERTVHVPGGRQWLQLELEFAAPKPFVKWAGGKSSVLPQLCAIMPAGVEAQRYLEPFAGGAAMFFGLLPRCAVLADINAQLVATYQCVQRSVEPLIERLRELAHGHCREQYYDVRERYNATAERLDTIERAADFVYLNKTCFNGLHRVNRRGGFNVPMGRYHAPRIADAAALRAASRALRDVTLRQAPFTAVLEYAQAGDFVYLDPPYDTELGKAAFTQYAAPFGVAEQDALADVFRALDARGCTLMLSNSDTAANRRRYAGYRVVEIRAPRAISRSAESRGSVTELVVCNYPGQPLAA
jgi:DNA adenine methylase